MDTQHYRALGWNQRAAQEANEGLDPTMEAQNRASVGARLWRPRTQVKVDMGAHIGSSSPPQDERR